MTKIIKTHHTWTRLEQDTHIESKLLRIQSGSLKNLEKIKVVRKKYWDQRSKNFLN